MSEDSQVQPGGSLPLQAQAPFKSDLERLQTEREMLHRERAKLFGIKPTVYIRNLDPKTDENEIKTWFSQCGPVREVRIQRDATNTSQCTAFVEFYYISSCDDACARFNQKYVDKQSPNALVVQPERKFQSACQALRSGKFTVQHIAAPGMPPGKSPQPPHQQHAQPPMMGRPVGHNMAHQQQYGGFDNYQQQAPSDTTVYLGHLRPDITQDMVRNALQTYGNIVELCLYPEKHFAFITFMDPTSARRCIESLNNQPSGLAKRGTQLLAQYKGMKLK